MMLIGAFALLYATRDHLLSPVSKLVQVPQGEPTTSARPDVTPSAAPPIGAPRPIPRRSALDQRGIPVWYTADELAAFKLPIPMLGQGGPKTKVPRPTDGFNVINIRCPYCNKTITIDPNGAGMHCHIFRCSAEVDIIKSHAGFDQMRWYKDSGILGDYCGGPFQVVPYHRPYNGTGDYGYAVHSPYNK